MITKHDSKVIRIQGDKLCDDLGYPKGTKIPIETIEAIASSNFGDVLTIDGKEVKLTMHMVGVAKILLEKIKG